MTKLAILLVSLWTVVSGGQFHVQGISYDSARDNYLLSFTSSFVKADRDGKIIASVDRINGHLGAVTFDADGRKAYASLELKDDSIGSAISKGLGEAQWTKEQSAFYIAEIDIDRLTRIGMKQEEVMTLHPVNDAIRDYKEGKYSCSGIDGVAIGPKPGGKGYGKCLYVAYGIYGDPDRTDNDFNVILRYSLEDLSRPLDKYFVYTGSTNWGIQNMCYDSFTGKLLLCVYKGRKPNFPNYDLYSIDLAENAFRSRLPYPGYDSERIKCLRLSDDGIKDEASGISGWRFPWGSTGICSFGGGYFLLSENGRTDGINWCGIRLYRWTGSQDSPFEPVSF